MNKVKIIVDSTCDLSKELYEQFDMEVVPLNVSFGEENYKDSVNINAEKLYGLIKEKGEMPHTAAASPLDIENAFKKYIDQGFDIVFLGIGSKLSTNYQNALIAKEECGGHVVIIDSNNLSSGTGLLALKAARMAKEGRSADEIYAEVQPLAEKLSTQFLVDTLDYLYKGGRCSGAAKIMGTLFHVHPMIKLFNGELIVYKKPRGTMKMCSNEMLSILKEDLPNVDLENIMITHSGYSEETLNYLKTELGKLVDPKCIRITQAGCVISTHCGPGTIGILYIKK